MKQLEQLRQNTASNNIEKEQQVKSLQKVKEETEKIMKELEQLLQQTESCTIEEDSPYPTGL